jgi:hypothetical protein
MRKLFALLTVVVAAVASPAALANHGHGHGNNGQAGGKPQSIALYRADCAGVATATQQVGTVSVKAKGQNDQGNGFGNGTYAQIQVRVKVTSGMANTSYRIYLLQSTGTGTCSVAATGPVLTTDGSGRGTEQVRFSTGSLAAGSYAIQLVAPATATVPGPGPFTDVLTTQFSITLPSAPNGRHHHK